MTTRRSEMKRQRALRFYCRQYRLDPAALRSKLDELDESQAWPAERILHDQRRRLRESLVLTAAAAPYYRSLFDELQIPVGEVAAPEHFSRIPIMRRTDFLGAGKRLCVPGDDRLVRWSSSSGSTGTPVRTAHGTSARLSGHGCRGRALRWYGVELWDKHGLVVAQQIDTWRRWASIMIDLFVGRRRNATFSMDHDTAVRLAEQLASFHPALIIGQPSFILRLAMNAADTRRASDFRAKLLLCNSELLTPCVDEQIATLYGCRVSNEYGCTEIGSMAHRCPAGTLHLNTEHVLVELVDPKGVPVVAGQMGEVILTTLANRYMPLVRYAVGDIAVRAKEPCSCGRQPGLPGLSHVVGRIKDVWHDVEGNWVDSYQTIGAAQRLLVAAGYWQSQFVQTAPRQIQLRTEPAQRPDPALLKSLATVFEPALGSGVVVQWPGDAIERTGSGKTSTMLRRDWKPNGDAKSD